MIEKFEYKGIWWLPHKPKERISGIFKFAPNEGVVLELIGSFEDITSIGETLDLEIILGTSSSGKNITLYKCFETKSLSVPGFSTSSFYANMAFVGAHFQKTEDIKFKGLSVHYMYLDEWSGISGFVNTQYSSNEKEIVIKYELPKPIQVVINDYKIFLDIKVTPSPLSIVQKEASIKQSVYIRVESSEEKSFDEYLNIIYLIQNFLSLGITEPVYPLIIEGKTEMNKETIKINKETINYYPPVKVYGASDIPIVPKTLYPPNMLFTFRDISDKFEFFLKNWFEKADLLEPVYNLYFETLYSPRINLKHRFLNLLQAIESYHRRTINNFEQQEKQHEKKIEEILNAVPHKHKDWLKDKLAYSNEPTLRKRLKDILKKFADVLNKFILNKNSFVEKVVTTRNYLTHYDKTLKKQSAEGEELYHLTQKIKILLEICLLKELGFTSDNIKNLISNKYNIEDISER